MIIEFLTQDDPLYILPFFDEFLRHYRSEFRISCIALCRTMGRRSRIRMIRELVALYGPLGFVRLAARNTLSRVLGKLPRTDASERFYSMPQLCRAYGIPWRHIGNPNGPEYVEELAARAPDLLVSVACPYILKAAVLSAPPRGCVNIHHAPLPRYKGMMPTFWQLYHGEKTVGVTIHFMTPRLDEGDALLQDSLEVRPGETLDVLIQRSKRHGAHCMARTIRDIASGTAQPRPLKGEGSYFTFPTPAESHEFRRRGFRAI